jgi:hypothetical protein
MLLILYVDFVSYNFAELFYSDILGRIFGIFCI